MGLVGQWEGIQARLPADWADARLALTLADRADESRAAALLGPLTPGRTGRDFRFEAGGGSGASPLAVARALTRLDEASIPGELRLIDAGTAVAAAEPPPRRGLAETWDAVLETLPSDWSDVYVELELTSSDDLDPGALALSPLNPARYGDAPGFRFRCARSAGYGASPGMVRRCLARLDERAIPAALRLLWTLSDTRPGGTQGPVWYSAGKVV